MDSHTNDGGMRHKERDLLATTRIQLSTTSGQCYLLSQGISNQKGQGLFNKFSCEQCLMKHYSNIFTNSRKLREMQLLFDNLNQKAEIQV